MKFFILFLLLSFGFNCFASSEEKALRYFLRATYKQTNLDNFVKNKEKKYINKDVKKYGGYVFSIGQIFVEKKVIIKWNF